MTDFTVTRIGADSALGVNSTQGITRMPKATKAKHKSARQRGSSRSPMLTGNLSSHAPPDRVDLRLGEQECVASGMKLPVIV
jgi:hypothetical protein